MIKNHYSADIQSFKNALNLQGTSQEIWWLADLAYIRPEANFVPVCGCFFLDVG